MQKIKVKNPIVEIDGDEMTRVLWGWIKSELILPYLDVDLKYFDLSITERDKTNDEITSAAAAAIKTYGVGIKCATITADEARVKEFSLKRMYRSPNATIRNILGGTIFREPIICRNIKPYVPTWQKPIVVARHAYGDQYGGKDLRITAAGKLYLRFVPDSNSMVNGEMGEVIEEEVMNFKTAGVALGMVNTDESIEGFARACFHFALKRGLPLYLSTKNTVLKIYDGRFKNIFAEIYEQEFVKKFEAAGLTYQHRLIDDMVAFALQNQGGFVWACKNYDGDVQSDQVAAGFGSLGLMTSVLFSPDGQVVETEAAHGTVTRHFRKYQMGQETSTNPIATIFAWSQGLAYRGKFDAQEDLVDFAMRLEQAVLQVVAKGWVTKDLLPLLTNQGKELTTRQFLSEVKKQLEQKH